MAALNTRLALSLVATFQKTAVMGSVPNDPLTLNKIIEYANGNGAGAADKLYYAERTIGASSNETLDISGGITDNVGNTFTIARVKMLLIIAEPSDPAATKNTNDVVVGAAAATQWAALLGTTGTLTLKPGAVSLHAAGIADATAWVATGGASDNLKVANGGAGTSVTYQIVIVGAS